MIVYLNLDFDDEEKAVLNEFIGRYKQEISILYSVNAEKIVDAYNPNRMIFIGGYYLLEEKESPKEWHMGMIVNDKYVFFGNYGDLRSAINGL